MQQTQVRVGYARSLTWIAVLALTVRLAAGVLSVQSYPIEIARVDFSDIACNLSAGNGFGTGGYVRDGIVHFRYAAYRPPLYPLLLAAIGVEPDGFVRILIQAAIGGGTAICGFLIARLLFGDRAAALAGLGIALYPYYAWHDAAIQETGVYTFLVAVGILSLLKARQSGSDRISTRYLVGAAVSLGCALLTRATLAPFIPLAITWVALVGGHLRSQRLWRAGLFACTLAVVVSPWLIRNSIVIGSPVITSQTGRLLWVAQNPDTFASYPSGLIDESRDVAFAALKPDELAALDRASATEMGENRWYEQRAIEFMVEHPRQVVGRGLEKVAAGFSWVFSPRKPFLQQVVYFLSYAPILLLGIAGAALARRSWRDHLIIYLLFLSFVVVSAVFWAHTTHRTFLDVYLIVFASYAVCRIWQRLPFRNNALAT